MRRCAIRGCHASCVRVKEADQHGTAAAHLIADINMVSSSVLTVAVASTTDHTTAHVSSDLLMMTRW
jgi:hypothetical protein